MGITNSGGGAPVGHCAYFPATTPPPGYIKRNGALLSRTTYAALWAYAQASGNMAANDAAWQAGMFSPGDGATTFRIPDGRGEFDRGLDDGRGVDAGRAIGSAQQDSVQDHLHSITTYATNLGGGSAPGTGQSTPATGSTNGMSNGRISSETRPRNVAYLACIKY